MTIKIFILSFLIIAGITAKAQSNQQNIADKIATKMKDSLSLSEAQKNLVFSVNMQLSTQKLKVRQLYQHIDSVTKYTQRAENTRDSMYRPILTEKQFAGYKEKKHLLISAN